MRPSTLNPKPIPGWGSIFPEPLSGLIKSQHRQRRCEDQVHHAQGNGHHAEEENGYGERIPGAKGLRFRGLGFLGFWGFRGFRGLGVWGCRVSGLRLRRADGLCSCHRVACRTTEAYHDNFCACNGFLWDPYWNPVWCTAWVAKASVTRLRAGNPCPAMSPKP